MGSRLASGPRPCPLVGGSSSSSDSLSLAICTKLCGSLTAFSTETPRGSLPFPFGQSLSKRAVTTHWPTDPFPRQKRPAPAPSGCAISRCSGSPWHRAAHTSGMTARLCSACRGAGSPRVTLSSGPPVGKERDRGTERKRGSPRGLKWMHAHWLLPWYLFHGWPAQFSSELITHSQIRSFMTRFLKPLFQHY